MPYWPPDGLWRVTVPSGSSIPISVPGALPIYQAPVPATAAAQLITQNAVVNTSGNSNIWTPSQPTLRVNLLGWLITISGNATRAATSATLITLNGAVSGQISSAEVMIPAAAGSTIGQDIILGPVTYDAPFRLNLNEILRVSLAAALVTGQMGVHVWGFETT